MIYERKFKIIFKGGGEINVTLEIDTEKCRGCDIEKITENFKKRLDNEGVEKIETSPLIPKQN